MKLGIRDVPAVSDDAVARVRDLIGVPLRRRGLNTEATPQSIRRWAVSVGERNLLWLDLAYGAKSRWGSVIAPPLWLNSVDDSVIDPGLEGLHSIYAGASWDFSYPIRAGDNVTAHARLTAIEERDTRFAGRTVRQTGAVTYELHDGRIAARVTSWVDRVSRAEAKARGLYSDIRKHRYTEDDLLRIEDDYDAEDIRGDRVRYWEDTERGESLTPVVKGPLTSEDITTFVCATAPVRTYGSQIRYRERHPLSEFLDEDTGRFDAWERAHLDSDVARQFGFPLPHDVGYQRIAWVSNLLTNWAGDDGQVRSLTVNLTRPNFHGDTTWCKGTVTSKEAAGIVRIDLWCENQRGETTATGEASIQLVTRDVASSEDEG